MTGCDLRYEAEQIATRASERALTLQTSLEMLAADVASLAPRIAEAVTSLRDHRIATADDVYETIEKVRSHFHEAVDARVAEEGGLDEEAVDEKVREAVDEAIESFRQNVERDVERAIRDAEAD